jgi:hypothetical protein
MSKKTLPLTVLLLAAVSALGGSPAWAADLYAGTSDPGIVYAREGGKWKPLSGVLGLAVLDLVEFRGRLYAATLGDYVGSSYAEIWRYEKVGKKGTWTRGFLTPNDPVDNPPFEVTDLEVWGGALYATTAPGGGHLYRYNETTDTFDRVGSVPDVAGWHSWLGIRKMFPWSVTGFLHLGDVGYDLLGHYDGSQLVYDADLNGSCIYDIAAFNGNLYASADGGDLLWSSDGLAWAANTREGFNIWELEVFKGKLYTGNADGLLERIDSPGGKATVWGGNTAVDRQITSMVVDGDRQLYLGTGRDVSVEPLYPGTARVYTYNGQGVPRMIFDADGPDTLGRDHAGVLSLLVGRR